MNTNVPTTKIISPVHLLHRAGQCADELLTTQLDEMQLTPRQYTVLTCAASLDGASQTDLVERTGIDRSTLADIVRRLVERGLLHRQRTRKDARMYAVHVTDPGRSVIQRATPVTEESEQRLLDAVDPADRAAFLRSLQSIITTFGPISSARVSGRTSDATPGRAPGFATDGTPVA